MTQIAELIARWQTDEGKPYKGNLINWGAYQSDADNIGCMCAQGQVLHLVAGWTPDRLHNVEQAEADLETAKLLNISRAHAVLLRQVNDSTEGAPAIVLTDPGKVLGDEWSKLLDFWWHLESLTAEQWAAAWAAAWDAARAAAGAAAWASWEIQGASILRRDGRPFFFLPAFGFASPDDIPARPANYGIPA